MFSSRNGAPVWLLGDSTLSAGVHVSVSVALSNDNLIFTFIDSLSPSAISSGGYLALVILFFSLQPNMISIRLLLLLLVVIRVAFQPF